MLPVLFCLHQSKNRSINETCFINRQYNYLPHKYKTADKHKTWSFRKRRLPSPGIRDERPGGWLKKKKKRKKKWNIFSRSIYIFSKNLLIHYSKYCNLIGYATRYLFVNRYWVAASNATKPCFSQNKCLFLVFWNNFEEITNTLLFLTMNRQRLSITHLYTCACLKHAQWFSVPWKQHNWPEDWLLLSFRGLVKRQ